MESLYYKNNTEGNLIISDINMFLTKGQVMDFSKLDTSALSQSQDFLISKSKKWLIEATKEEYDVYVEQNFKPEPPKETPIEYKGREPVITPVSDFAKDDIVVKEPLVVSEAPLDDADVGTDLPQAPEEVGKSKTETISDVVAEEKKEEQLIQDKELEEGVKKFAGAVSEDARKPSAAIVKFAKLSYFQKKSKIMKEKDIDFLKEIAHFDKGKGIKSLAEQRIKELSE